MTKLETEQDRLLITLMGKLDNDNNMKYQWRGNDGYAYSPTFAKREDAEWYAQKGPMMQIAEMP